MSDETLRHLEREAASDPLARVRLARSLERAGRRDDALAALLPAIDVSDARAEVARFVGASTVARGDIIYVDAAPVVMKPAVRWRTPVTTAPSVSLVASELGIVVLSAFETVALDARTGRARWRAASELPPSHRPRAWICGSVLLVVTPGSLVARDLWTGGELFRLPGAETLVAVADGVAVFRNGSTVTARSLANPTKPVTTLWTATFNKTGAVAAGGSLVVVEDAHGMVCMDSTTGTVRWKAPGTDSVVDSDGVGAWIEATNSAPRPSRSRQEQRVLYTPDGRPAWQRRDGLTLRGLAPEVAVAVKIRGYRRHWASIDRASGRVLGVISANMTAIAGARGVIYVASGDSEGGSIYRERREPMPWSRLAAIGVDGVERWRITPEEHADYFVALAPLGARLFAIERRRRGDYVTCMARPDTLRD